MTMDNTGKSDEGILENLIEPDKCSSRDIVIGVLFAVIAILPFLDIKPAFRSDDVLLIAQGQENSILGGALRSFMRPFGDTRSIEFYRPLFSFNFCLEGHLFGNNPLYFQIVNLVLQGFSVFLAYLFALQLIGRRAALFATLIFALSPWSTNNVSWIAGRCTVVATIAMFAVALLHNRARLTGRSVSWAAFIVGALGVFYRETAFFAPVFAWAIDAAWRRRPTFRSYAIYCLPFLAYLGAKVLVLGTLLGGYRTLTSVRGFDAGLFNFSVTDFGQSLGRLLLLAPEVVDGALGTVSYIVLGISVLAVGTLAWKMAWRRWVFWALLAFIAAHGFLLCMADSVIRVGTAQRWHTVMWAMSALLGLGLALVPRRILGIGLVLVLSATQVFQLRAYLEDYDRSADLSIALAKAVNESVEDQVFIYNLKPYVGAAPFFEIGAGQVTHPPFARGTKAVYPIVHFNAYGKDALLTQTPIAAHLLANGELASVLWIDYESVRVFDLPPDDSRVSLKAFKEIKQLELQEPTSTRITAGETPKLRFDVKGINRIEIHLVCPVVEIRFTRKRGMGSFEKDAGHFSEDLTEILEMASHMIRGSKSRAWLWVATYESRDELAEPKSVSSFIELELHTERN
ncbi:MAG: hypothetical protein ACI97A_001393 [Planctomycetota bacterium]|jgi:hypothetical protein